MGLEIGELEIGNVVIGDWELVVGELVDWRLGVNIIN